MGPLLPPILIPVESYFQTLGRRYATTIESRSLTLSKFDHQGKPHIFYDDHLQLLRKSDCFVARKICRVPTSSTVSSCPTAPMVSPPPTRIRQDRPPVFKGHGTPRKGPRGAFTCKAAFPNRDHENGKTAAPYHLFEGYAELFEDFEGWLSRVIRHARPRPPLRPGPRPLRGRRHRVQRRPVRQPETARLQHARLPHEPHLEHPRRTPVLPVRPADNQAPRVFMATDPTPPSP